MNASMHNKEIATVLNGAADLIETKGWTQGAPARNADGHQCLYSAREATCYCASGAIAFTAAAMPELGGLAVWSERVLEQEIGFRNGVQFSHQSVPRWNDQSSRTADQVIRKLRAAAERAVA